MTLKEITNEISKQIIKNTTHTYNKDNIVILNQFGTEYEIK